jgi:hypothetical protein
LDANPVLTKYESAVQALARAEYKARVITYRKKGNEPEKLQQDLLYSWRCKDSLVKSSAVGKGWNVYSSANEELEHKQVLLVDARRDRLNVSWRPDGSIGILMDRQPSAVALRQPFGVNAFPLLHGYVNSTGVPYLPEVLRQSRLSSRPDSLDNRRVVVLEGKGRSGHLQLWCDPNTDYWPRRLEWRLGANDVLVDPTGDKPQEKTLTRLGLMASFVLADGWDFARVGNRWVPTAFTLHKKMTYSEGQPEMAVRAVCTISDIAIAPAHLNDPAAFELGDEIPDGTSVTVSGEPQIQHIWLGGKVIKKVDADVSALEGHSMPGKERPKTLLLLAAIAAAIVIGLVAWRRRVARR